MTGADLPRLLTLEEAAELACCSKSTLRRRIAKGELPAISHGRLVRVSINDLGTFLRSKRRWNTRC